jgi:hypothetical protein
VNGKRMPRWPLALIGAPAAVAVWSGWVGLGQLCGFGVIHLLPGIWDSATINTAITLPIGVEAYGAYALGAWLTPGTSARARRFARRSAVGALALGMLGQVAFHLLEAAHATHAPWPVTMFVSCLPVVALALGTALAHLLREPADDVPSTDKAAETVAAVIPAPPEVELDTVADTPVMAPAVPVDGPEDVATGDVPAAPPVAIHTVSRRRTPRRTSPGKPRAHAKIFAAEIERAELPSLREVMRRAGVGQSRGREILAELQETIDAQEVTADAA